MAETKGKKKGPWGLAQQRIARANSSTLLSKPTKRAIGRRKRRKRGPKDNKPRQHRKVYKVEKVLGAESAKGKHLYVKWGPQYTEAGEVLNTFNFSSNDILDVSNYRIIDLDPNGKGHAVVVDDTCETEPLFICAKIDSRQSRSSTNGRTGLNTVRSSLQSLKKSKPNQTRGSATSGMNNAYLLIGHRKDPLTSENSTYTFKKGTDPVSNLILQTIYTDFSYKMERAGKTLGNALYETGVYKIVKEQSRVPAVGREPINKDKPGKRKSLVQDTGFATALAVGEHYWSKAHVDRDFYFSVLSALSASTHDIGKVLHYFIFPAYQIMIPIKSGDILLFSPTVLHSCSNPSLPNSILLSSYVSRQTVLVAETSHEKSKVLVDSVVEDVLKSMK